MMVSMSNDFFVEDESPEEIRRSLQSGTPVLVIPSRWRRVMRVRLGKILKDLSDDLGRAAERVGTAGTAQSSAREGGRGNGRNTRTTPTSGTAT
jgi:hypothetical protein